jgi:hypothetical protein
MAWYLAGSAVYTADGTEAIWSTDYSPGATVPNSGIYKCRGCNREVTSNKGDPFPPQSHHTHTAAQGTIRWRLLVWTDTQGSRG